MSAIVNAGPFISVGQCFTITDASGNQIPPPEPNFDAGPCLTYQGDGFLDPRYFIQKDYATGRPGSILAHLNSPYILSVDAVPAASAATPVNIAAAQAGTAVALTLAAAAAGISTNVPFYPFKSATLTTAPIALDFGFLGAAANAAVDTCTVTTTNGNQLTASSLLAASNFYVGQWLVIPNALTATTALITYVTAVSGVTITLANNVGIASTTIVMVGTANIPNTSWLGNPTATGASPYLAGGIGGFLDPKQSLCRCVGVNAAAGATATTCTIAGWDIYGQPQTEAITLSAGATVYGKKTWKYIQSATLNATDGAHNYSVGTGDTFGFVVRSDRWEYSNIFFAGSFASTSSGWLAGDLTTPATTTTGDVRGTVQSGARGNGSTPSAPLNVSSDGIRRLALFSSVPLYNVLAATPTAPQPLYGNKPV